MNLEKSAQTGLRVYSDPQPHIKAAGEEDITNDETKPLAA